MTQYDIIHHALPAIKAHYKYRPRGPGGMDVRYDVATSEGLIADGFIQFEDEDGAPFIVTVEATGQDSIDEVIYTIQNPLLNWDSIATASVLLAAGYAWFHHKGGNAALLFGEIPTLALLIAGLCFGLFTFRILLGWMRRYRYIYAIEQFKKYKANEQWVAIGEDLFPSHQDSYFIELKKQCVDNGVGMVIVDEKGAVQLLATPSREEVHEHRAVANFGNRQTVAGNLSNQKMTQWLKKGTSRFTQARSTVGLTRFRAKLYKQMSVLVLSLLVVGGIYFKEWQSRPIAYANERQYEEDLLEHAGKLRPENRTYKREAGPSLYNDSLTGNYLDLSSTDNSFEEDSVKFVVKSGDLLELDASFYGQVADSQEVVVSLGDGVVADYDCERFYNFKETLYLVQDEVFDTHEAAKKRMELVKSFGIPVNVVWLGCFGTTKSHAVFYNLMYADKSEAKVAAQTYMKLLRKHGIRYGTIHLRSIQPPGQ